jgi:beta-barrel assembly-enhancing protease
VTRPSFKACLALGFLGSCWSSQIVLSQPIDDDEAGLLLKVEKQEQLIRTSQFRTNAPGLESELNEMACMISPEDCDRLRIYLLDLPGLNAFVLPNGAIFVQTGLLLRLENESQLAAVIAHEIVHFREKHTLESVRRASDQAATFAVLGALVGAAGSVAAAGAATPNQWQSVSNASQTASLMLQSMQVISGLALLEFSRDNEEESDMQGAELAAKAGYLKAAGMELWLAYMAEDAAAGGDQALSLLSTHPLPKSRVQYLSKFRDSDQGGRVRPPTNVTDDLEAFREGWLLMELRVLHPDQFAFLADKQQRDWNVSLQLVSHLKAESWIRYSDRQGLSRSQVEDAREAAMAAFASGADSPSGLSADGYRDWGMLAIDMADTNSAKRALTKYLELSPDAWDAQFIKKKLDSL